ncbi:dnaJ subfamily A member 1, partial [Biomphalaria glabrata]
IIDIPDPHSAYNDLLQDLKDVIDVKILLSNGLWVNPASSLLQQYKKNVLTLYEATIEDIDFSFPEGPEASINKWLWYKTGINTSSMFTNGYIHRNTSLILINTFIFIAKWQYPFPKEMTKKRMFTKLNGIPVATEFMSYSSIYALKLNAVKNVDVIRVPFEYEGFGLYIALPRSSKGLHELESIITNENFDVHDLFANLRMTSVHLSMPKFNLTATLNFNLALSSLGMSEAFTNTSNFSGMSNTRLRLSDVVQKTTVQFSESYMTTPSFFNTNISIPVNNSSALGDVNFIANHSFLYFLRDDINDLILLQGKYSDPEIQEIIVK